MGFSESLRANKIISVVPPVLFFHTPPDLFKSLLKITNISPVQSNIFWEVTNGKIDTNHPDNRSV